MSTATAEPAIAEVSGALVPKFQGIERFLKKHNFERDEVIELLILSTLAQSDPLLLGDPGVGKTWLIELFTDHCITGATLFTHLFAQEQSASEVIGLPDPKAIQEGKLRRLLEGMLPEATIGYGDEVFKTSPSLLNALLSILAERKLKVGGEVVDCKGLLVFVMSSNELPQREDLMAFRDRIGLTYHVEAVRTREARKKIAEMQLRIASEGVDTSELEPVTQTEVEEARAEIVLIEVPDAIIEKMMDAQEQWAALGIAPSQRRMGQMWKMVRASAWFHGRTKANTDDLLPLQHMAWNNPEHMKPAAEVILAFASEFTQTAQKIKADYEPLRQQMEALKPKIEAADADALRALVPEGYSVMTEMGRLHKIAADEVKKGIGSAQDVSALESIRNEIKAAHEWAKSALSGEDLEP